MGNRSPPDICTGERYTSCAHCVFRDGVEDGEMGTVAECEVLISD